MEKLTVTNLVGWAMLVNKIIVKNHRTGRYGTLEASMFGGSVYWINEKSGELSKGLSQSIDAIMDRWEEVDLPEGYEIGKDGGIKKIL